MRKGELEKQRAALMTKVLAQKKKEKVKKEGQQSSQALLSFVICYNCGRKGHRMKSCTSASRAVFKKIQRKAESINKEKKKI